MLFLGLVVLCAWVVSGWVGVLVALCGVLGLVGLMGVSDASGKVLR